MRFESGTDKTTPLMKNMPAGVAIAKMDPKLEGLGINGSAGKITQYIHRFNFRIDTRRFSHGGREGSIYPAKNFGLPQNLKGRFNSKKFMKHLCDTSGMLSSNWSNGRSFIHWSKILMKLNGISMLGCNANPRRVNLELAGLSYNGSFFPRKTLRSSTYESFVKRPRT